MLKKSTYALTFFFKNIVFSWDESFSHPFISQLVSMIPLVLKRSWIGSIARLMLPFYHHYVYFFKSDM